MRRSKEPTTSEHEPAAASDARKPVRNRAAGPRIRQVPAVTRAAAILRLLGGSSEPLGVNAISRQLGLITSTCLHILRALVAEDLVAFDPATKRYELGVGVLSLSRALLRSSGQIKMLQSELDRVTQQFDVTTTLARIISADRSVIVGVRPSTQPLRLNVEIGSRFPTLISATGRCFAAFTPLSSKEIIEKFHRLRWHKAPTLKEWKQQVAETRDNGYGVDEGNYIQGATVVAVPVFDHYQQMTYSAVAVGQSEQMNIIGIRRIAAQLKAAADYIDR